MTYGLPFAGDALVMVYRPNQVGYAPKSWTEYTSREYPVLFPAGDGQALITTQMLLSVSPEEHQPAELPPVDLENLKKAYLTLNEGTKNGTFPYWLAEYDSFEKGYQAFLENRSNYAVVWVSSVIHHLPEMWQSRHCLPSMWHHSLWQMAGCGRFQTHQKSAARSPLPWLSS